MTLQYCQLLHSTHFTQAHAAMREGARLFSSFSFWLDATLWQELLKRLRALDCASYKGFSTSENTAVTSKEHPARTEVAYNLLNSMNCLAVGTILSMVLQPFSSFAEHGLHSPSTTMGSRRQPKSGKQTRWAAKEASKAFYGYPQAGVSGKSYTVHHLLKWVAVIVLVATGHGSLASRVVHSLLTPLDYAMIIHSLVGFKTQKIRSGSPHRFNFLREWCRLGTRLSISCCPFLCELS